MTQEMSLQLSACPDAYGFIYGSVTDLDGFMCKVNILPPIDHWQGQFRLEGYEPHNSDWLIYLDGELVARAKSEIQIIDVIAKKLN